MDRRCPSSKKEFSEGTNKGDTSKLKHVLAHGIARGKSVAEKYLNRGDTNTGKSGNDLAGRTCIMREGNVSVGEEDSREISEGKKGTGFRRTGRIGKRRSRSSALCSSSNGFIPGVTKRGQRTT